MAVIAEAEVLRIAELAHLELNEREVAKMTRELGAILSYVAQLEALDVAGVPPTAHAAVAAMPLRDDAPGPSLERAQVLSEAPRASEDGFAVPSFVDEG